MNGEIEYFLEGVNSPVRRFKLGERTIEYWVPEIATDRILIAHDGQCIFDTRVAKKATTWQLVQNSIKVAAELDVTPPLIIGIWHQGEVGDSVARGLDLSPDSYFKSGIPLFPKNGPFDVNATKGDQYLNEIFETYLPEVLSRTNAAIFTRENRDDWCQPRCVEYFVCSQEPLGKISYRSSAFHTLDYW
jgi:hypothetical protein